MIHDVASVPEEVNYVSSLMLDSLLKKTPIQSAAPFLSLPETVALPNKLNQPYIVIHPGAGKATRFWPAERYAQVADYLVSQGYSIVFTGNAAESTLINAITTKMKQNRFINLTGKTSLLTLAKTIATARLLIAPDTGVIHLARNLDISTLCLMGVSQLDLFGPNPRLYDKQKHIALYIPDLNCRDKKKLFGYTIPGVRRCDRERCLFQDHPCMRQVSVQQVIDGVGELIGG